MANRIIIVDEDFTGDNIQFVVRTTLPHTITGLQEGQYYLLNTVMSDAIMVNAEPVIAREAYSQNTISVHSGHSLTDSYVHTGPWPGSMRLLNPASEQRIIKSTIPGSPIHWRWDNASSEDYSAPDYRGDARLHVENFHSLVITEGGPPPHVTDSEGMEMTLDYLCRFVANQIENGAGNDVVLWSIWPDLRGPGAPSPVSYWQSYSFRSGLPEYGKSFKYLADYVTWKMHELYPSLPADWEVWLMPGHKWMERVYDDIQNDLVPGVNDIAELFSDDIHPNSLAGYGLACFTTTCLYQRNLTEESDVWIAGEHSDHNGTHPAVTQAQAEYFWQIAWEIATSYGPIGMGGADEPIEWEPSMGDPLPSWVFDDGEEPSNEVAPINITPPQAFGTITEGEDLLGTDGTWDGSVPIISSSRRWEVSDDDITWEIIPDTNQQTFTITSEYVGKYLRYTAVAENNWGTTVVSSTSLGPVEAATEIPVPTLAVLINNDDPDYTGPTDFQNLVHRVSAQTSIPTGGNSASVYSIIALRLDQAPSQINYDVFALTSSTNNARFALQSNGWINSLILGYGISLEPYDINLDPSVQFANMSDWLIIEMWTNGDTMYRCVNGGEVIESDIETWVIPWNQEPITQAARDEVYAARFNSVTLGASSEHYEFCYFGVSHTQPDNLEREALRNSAAAAIARADNYTEEPEEPETPLVNLTLPIAGGSTQMGQSVTTTDGTWNVTPNNLTYQWFSSTDGTEPWTSISGETSETIVNTPARSGQYLRCRVVASNSAGDVSVNSNIFGPIEEVIGGDLPTFDIRWDSTGYTGPTLTGDLPTIEDDKLIFQPGGDNVLIAPYVPGGTNYMIAAIRLDAAQANRVVHFVALREGTGVWDPGPSLRMNGWMDGGDGRWQAETEGSDAIEIPFVAGSWVLLEAIWTPTSQALYLNGTLVNTETSEENLPTHLHIWDPEATTTGQIAALGICSYVPTEMEREGARDWANSRINTN